MNELLSALDTLRNNGLDNVGEIVDQLLKANDFEDDDDIKLLVILAERLERGDGFITDIEVSKHDDCVFEVEGEMWLVCTEDERDSKWDDALESYLDECVDGASSPYFDREQWKKDARMDGAGHTLSSYDGNEYEYNTGNDWYFLYRMN